MRAHPGEADSRRPGCNRAVVTIWCGEVIECLTKRSIWRRSGPSGHSRSIQPLYLASGGTGIEIAGLRASGSAGPPWVLGRGLSVDEGFPPAVPLVSDDGIIVVTDGGRATGRSEEGPTATGAEEEDPAEVAGESPKGPKMSGKPSLPPITTIFAFGESANLSVASIPFQRR